MRSLLQIIQGNKRALEDKEGQDGCDNCRFLDGSKCRRMPPTQKVGYLTGLYPIVPDKKGCGEWSPK